MNNKIDIKRFRDVRNSISHFDISKTTPNKQTLFKLDSIGTNLISNVYHMLRYDLKKQKTFITSIEKIFEKEGFKIIFNKEGDVFKLQNIYSNKLNIIGSKYDQYDKIVTLYVKRFFMDL